MVALLHAASPPPSWRPRAALGQIDTHRFQDVLKRRFNDIESSSQDLLEVGTTCWEALFNPQRLNLGTVAAETILNWRSCVAGAKSPVTDIPARPV